MTQLPRNSPINSLDHTNPCMAWHPFNHPMTSGQSPCCTSSLPCFHAGTGNSELDSWTHSTPPLSIASMMNWNLKFLKSWLQDWQPLLCLQAIVSCPLDRVWGHWWRNFMDTCFQNSLQTSTQDTWVSMTLCQAFSLKLPDHFQCSSTADHIFFLFKTFWYSIYC